METLRSALDTSSEAFAANETAQRALVEQLNERQRVTALGGPKKSLDRPVARG